MRSTAHEKLLPPLVAKVRKEVHAWRTKGYAGASATTVALLRWWFETEHLTENADGSLSPFRYYFSQREAVERAARSSSRPRQIRSAPFRCVRRCIQWHVRRGLAALRAQDGDRRREDEGAVPAHRMEFLSQALRS